MQTDGEAGFAEWDDERYSTQIERFDRQHRRLFGLLNDLHTAMEEGHSEEEVGDILRELERYTEYHFGDEEEFMQDCGYAIDCANCFYDHREMHREFAEKVSELRERHENGDYVTMEVLLFARDWLDSHIAAVDEDQNYGEYFREEVDEDYEYSPGNLRSDRDAGAESDAEPDRPTDGDFEVEVAGRVQTGDTLSVPQGSVGSWFGELADRYGDRPAAVVHTRDGFVERSFTDLYERARAVAAGLLETGVRSGDRVAVCANSRYEWSVVDLACHLLGVVSVPVYPSFDADQQRRIVEQTGPELAVSDGSLDGAAEDAVGTAVPLEKLPTAGVAGLPDPDPADVATVVFDVTGPGDRGGCALTHRNLLAAATALQAGLPLGPGATGTCFLPLAHIYQRVATYYLWAGGNAVAYVNGTDPVGELRSVRPDVVVGVPQLYQQLYGALQDRIGELGWMKRKAAGSVAGYGEAMVEGERTGLQYAAAERLAYRPLREEFGLDELDYALSGVERVDEHLLHFFRGLGVPVCDVYGAVETTGVGALNHADSFDREAVGDPMSGTELAVSQDGEVLVRGPTVMARYTGDEVATRRAVRDGWYHTGDDGRSDPELGVVIGE